MLTEQQLAIVHHDYVPGKRVIVRALAGTGKTTTLEALLRHWDETYPTKRVLYLAYNRQVVDYARTRLPLASNITIATFDSLAYRFLTKMGYTIQIPGVRTAMVNSMKLPKGHTNLGYLIVDTLEKFCNSQDTTITHKHLPEGHKPSKRTPVSKILSGAMRLWTSCQKPGEMPISFTVAEKIYAAQKPTLAYDLIAVDEAQDLNPNMLTVTESQTHAAILYVGDPHQQLYEFKGAVNTFEILIPFRTLDLTASFRFGPSIAAVAQAILDQHGTEQTIVGARPDGHPGYVLKGTQVPHDRHCFIGRTNYAILEKTASIVRDPNTPDTTRIHILGNRKHLDDLVSEFGLYLNHPETYVRTKGSLYDKIMATEDESLERHYAIRFMVAKYQEETAQIINGMKRHMTDNPALATCTLTTVHQAKGKEFDRVVLLDDFRPEDTNMLYVAVTRAQSSLHLDPLVFDIADT